MRELNRVPVDGAAGGSGDRGDAAVTVDGDDASPVEAVVLSEDEYAGNGEADEGAEPLEDEPKEVSCATSLPLPAASPCRLRCPTTKTFQHEAPISSHFLRRAVLFRACMFLVCVCFGFSCLRKLDT